MSYHIHVYMCLMIILGVIVPFRFRPFSSHLHIHTYILFESLAGRAYVSK